MTSVPKPLKFLRPHYETLKHCHSTGDKTSSTHKLLADLLAVLAMTMSKRGSRGILLFKQQGSMQDLGSWGHQFVRSLAGEIGAEYSARHLADKVGNAEIDTHDLAALVDEIVPQCHSAMVLFTEIVLCVNCCSQVPSPSQCVCRGSGSANRDTAAPQITRRLSFRSWEGSSGSE